MSTSTDGHLSFGILFEEGFEFPWDTEDYENDIEVWWRDIKGFVNPVDCPFDEDGNFKPGYNHENSRQYYQEISKWHRANPVPVELVNYCSGDYPMFILAAKTETANRGYPVEIPPEFFTDAEEAYQRLMAFVEEFNIAYESEPKWYLSSCWRW